LRAIFAKQSQVSEGSHLSRKVQIQNPSLKHKIFNQQSKIITPYQNLGYAKVHQHGFSLQGDFNVDGFDIAVNDGRIL